MAENALSILSFDGKTLGVTGEIKVKGGPAGLRTAERYGDRITYRNPDAPTVVLDARGAKQ